MKLRRSEEEDPYYGFYSQKSVNDGHGSMVWSTPEGGEVQVTLACLLKRGWDEYKWEDTESKGGIVKFLRVENECLWPEKSICLGP